MIERQTIEGREAVVAYVTGDMQPAEKEDADLAKVVFDDGEVVWLTLGGEDDEESDDDLGTDAKKFEESKHPRDESGKFGEGGGSFKDIAEISDDEIEAKVTVDIARSRLEADKTIPLTLHEAAHVVAFTQYAFQETNKALRKKVTTRAIRRHVKVLNEALKKLPPHEGTTHRSADISRSVAKKYKPGMIIEERGFLSTSKSNRGESDNFEIRGKTGRDISALSHLPREQEVLFRSGTRFRVLSNNDGKKIVLEEVGR